MGELEEAKERDRGCWERGCTAQEKFKHPTSSPKVLCGVVSTY